jgi:hypothetical protein
MVLVADLFSGLLAFVFGGATIGKLLRQRQQVQTAAKLQIPWDRYRWIAAPEAAASLGLLIGYASAPFCGCRRRRPRGPDGRSPHIPPADP